MAAKLRADLRVTGSDPADSRAREAVARRWVQRIADQDRGTRIGGPSTERPGGTGGQGQQKRGQRERRWRQPRLS